MLGRLQVKAVSGGDVSCVPPVLVLKEVPVASVAEVRGVDVGGIFGLQGSAVGIVCNGLLVGKIVKLKANSRLEYFEVLCSVRHRTHINHSATGTAQVNNERKGA